MWMSKGVITLNQRWDISFINILYKQMESSDILFENEDVCILHPASSRGILVFTVSGTKKICTEGLFSYNELRKVHPELGLANRSRAHHDPSHNDLIFFRAPYNTDTTSFETSFDGKTPKDIIKPIFSSDSQKAIAVIRIDPAKTFIYSSETRALGSYSDLMRSRIPMMEYLLRIRGHSSLRPIYPQKSCGNIITFEKGLFPSTMNCSYPWKEYLPVERMAEVVVKLPHIPPSWFVSCDDNGMEFVQKRRKQSRRNKQTRRNRRVL
jgi:hypothetical protein